MCNRILSIAFRVAVSFSIPLSAARRSPSREELLRAPDIHSATPPLANDARTSTYSYQ